MTRRPTFSEVPAGGWLLCATASELWPEIFGDLRPVAVEIGCGRGEFLAEIARREPEKNFLGIERSWGRCAEVQKRISSAGLGNVRIVAGDATCIVATLPPQSVAAYYVLFPDPWWKRRHHRRRLFQPSFVANLARTLEPGGTLDLVTDVADYFALAEGQLAAHPGLCVTGPSPLGVPATTFALKARRRGASILSLRCVRR